MGIIIQILFTIILFMGAILLARYTYIQFGRPKIRFPARKFLLTFGILIGLLLVTLGAWMLYDYQHYPYTEATPGWNPYTPIK